MRIRYLSLFLFMILFAVSIISLCGEENQSQPDAKNYFPMKAELQSIGLSGWILPWELQDYESEGLKYQKKYNSPEEYFADNELSKTLASKDKIVEEFNSMPASFIEEMKSGLKEGLSQLDEQGVKLSTLFPSPQEQIQLDLIDLVRQEKFTKEAMLNVYKRHLEPLNSASELVYASVKFPPENKPEEKERGAKIVVRIYLYEPSAVQANLSAYIYTKTDLDYYEKRFRDFYDHISRVLLKEKGIELEEELEEFLMIPSKDLSSYDKKRIQELYDGLDAIDMLPQYPPKIDSSMPQVGDQCVTVRSIYTFPESERIKLDRSEGEVATQISSMVRQGSAKAFLELTTNDNSFWSPQSWDALLKLMAKKLEQFRFN